MSQDAIVVLDFETTGLSPLQGDRAIEIGAVKLQQGVVVDRFQQLMNPGFAVSSFIADYTGITNAMLSDAPGCETVMADFADFIQGCHLVAHNASFDQKFLAAEFARINLEQSQPFACSLLLARRLFQAAPNHQLGTLVNYLGIANDGVFHRALNDAEVTGALWLALSDAVSQRWACPAPSFELMLKLQRQPKHQLEKFMRSHLG
ncbi:3'-5' exonuclease [Shewanella rhizosphaerae]|uniref:3'-5' exonuclease n=1 Tax=Shewanella rhizosphaerae TaxID=2864207 RepID=UPI001C6592F3|nr:3'-5' exonuclease [Shewanella rhizosphaerae]QYK14719.1 3'-5' exonuclease [Shewanella rhizosphaerae]